MNDNKIELSGIFSNGYGIIPKKLMQNKELNVYDKCILAYMLSFTGGGNVCFPSYKKIAEDLQISEPTIAKSLKKLSGNGFIKIELLYPEDRLKHNNKYILSFLNEATILNDVKSHATSDEVSRFAKLSSNNNINNNNILNNKNSDLYQEITKIIYNEYLLLTKEKLIIDAKEGKAIKEIIKKCTTIDKDFPITILKYKISILTTLIKNDTRNYYHMTPSCINSNWQRITHVKKPHDYED